MKDAVKTTDPNIISPFLSHSMPLVQEMRFLLVSLVLLLPMVMGKEEKKYNYTMFDQYQKWCRVEGFPQDYHWIDYLIRVIGVSLLCWQFVLLCILGMMNMDVTTDNDDFDVDLEIEQVSLATENSAEVVLVEQEDASNYQSQNDEASEQISGRPEALQRPSASANPTNRSNEPAPT